MYSRYARNGNYFTKAEESRLYDEEQSVDKVDLRKKERDEIQFHNGVRLQHLSDVYSLMKGKCKRSKIFVKKVLFYDETNLGGGIKLVGRVGG